MSSPWSHCVTAPAELFGVSPIPVRETLESAALAAAVLRATDAERAHVAHTNQLLEDAVAEDDPQTYHRQSRIFHMGLTRPTLVDAENQPV